MGKQMWRYQAFAENSKALHKFCREYGFAWQELNNGYQWRIEDVIDVYPVRLKWHWIETGERGEAIDFDDMKKILLTRLHVQMPAVVKVVDGEFTRIPEDDGYKELKAEEQLLNIIEYTDDTPKWMTALYYLFVVLMVAMVLLGIYFLLTTIVQQ